MPWLPAGIVTLLPSPAGPSSSSLGSVTLAVMVLHGVLPGLPDGVPTPTLKTSNSLRASWRVSRGDAADEDVSAKIAAMQVVVKRILSFN